MPPRPAIKVKGNRPISAIYIGSSSNYSSGASANSTQQFQPSSSSSYPANDTSPGLPDLPEPPSPSSSIGSRGSGLPSPPATNSTGSGSTGDPGSIALRQRPLSFASDSSASTSSSSHKTMSEAFKRSSIHDSGLSSRSSSRIGQIHDGQRQGADDDDDNDNGDNNDNELDGDDTARLDRRQHFKSSSENILALQRAKSLTQRNRLALDKLTRLRSPSPTNNTRSSTPRSRSPVPSHTSSASSSRLRQVRTLPQTPAKDHGQSGSETERESTSMQTFSSHSRSSSSHASSSRRPITPPAPNASTVTFATNSSPYNRLRHLSAPGSPHKARQPQPEASPAPSDSSNSPSRRRKRASMATMTAIRSPYDDDEDIGGANRFSTATGTRRDRDTVRDITQSALAAVASTRRRSALPREFREDLAGNQATDTRSLASEARSRRSEESDLRSSRLPPEPVTPYRRNNIGRSFTLREVRRGEPGGIGNLDGSPGDSGKKERRATLRGGSAESALGLRSPGGRTLVGESLRAAGLGFKRDEGRESVARGDLFPDKRVEWSPADSEDKGKRRVFTPARDHVRAATSMADYRYLDRRAEEETQRDRALRNHRSTYSLSTNRDRDASTSRAGRELSLTRTERDHLELDRNGATPSTTFKASTATAVPQHLQERQTTGSPFGSKRLNSQTPGPGNDHARLMLDSLTMFESSLSKLPSSSGPTSIGSLPSNAELLKHAQSVVYTTERINALMKQGSGRALEEQINSEVEGDDSSSSKDVLEVWKKVGAEYREGLRASDELVRAVTSFLMDVGAVVRKLAPSSTLTSSPAMHSRSVSLDEEGLRQQQAGSDSGIASGRRSADSRRSWEPAMRDREREREDILRMIASRGDRDGSLALARASPALLALRDRDRSVLETPSPASSASRPLPQLSNEVSDPAPVRRLYTPREQRERQLDNEAEVNGRSALKPSDSQRTLQGTDVEPSPTPASRAARDTIGRDRRRPLPPLTLPRPLPTLPSEQSRKVSDTGPERTTSVRDRERRKTSVASIATVRGSGPSFSSLTTPSTATTSVTPHTVSNAPEAPSLLRSESNKSARSSVTFSRPNTLSVSAALSGIQQQALDDERKRTFSATVVAAEQSRVLSQPQKTPSGSENERDARRKTLGSRTMRMALDGPGLQSSESAPTVAKNLTVHAADRSAVSTILPLQGRKERRRTVTDIWPRE